MISKEEQKDLFYTLHSYNLIELIKSIQTECNNSAEPILNNENNTLLSDFVELILDNIDLKKMYINHYKKKKNI